MLGDSFVLLAAWDEAAEVSPAARVAVLVHRAGLTPDLDTALDLDIGSCAVLAVRAHVAAFGRHVRCLARCEACAAVLETEFELTERLADAEGAAVVQGGKTAQVQAFTVNAPTARDLLAVAEVPPDDAVAALFARCVRHADGSPVVSGELSPQLVADVDAAADHLAGFAAAQVCMACSDCGSEVRVALDPGALLWDQVDAAAPLLLSQVAALAAAFGWSERDVLAMTAVRRTAYLALVTG
ncbi:hypothetical protein ACFYNL_05940 [Streptomyces sp. NPDC007808]|uniref:hypothetical protein n=1 Tax=Streptomyces sp. NPDC007808 TaxID=3364779 RepID=UPI00369B1B8A